MKPYKTVLLLSSIIKRTQLPALSVYSDIPGTVASLVMAFAIREYLCFGDVVLFNVQTKDMKGYVYSDLSSSPYNFLTVYNTKEDEESILPNVSCASFKVLPSLKSKARQYLAELKQKNSSGKGYQRLLREAISSAKAEDHENEVEQERHISGRVEYGDFIQLQHIVSKKFVKVCSKGSKTESNNLLVNLSSENVESCTFRIMPKYKVRSEGDKVRFIDHVKLESVSNRGQYLHCSNRSLGVSQFHALPDCFELNLSAAESALSIIYQYSSFIEIDKGIRYGECVRLFHKEDECYIVAEGSFADNLNPVTENVHCRVRHTNSKRHAMPSTSANTYWQIEKQKAFVQCQYISWGDKCRLKHLPTRCYLAVVKSDGQWKVTLKNKPVNETMFVFSPFISESEVVLYGSFAMIQHCASGRWLHVDKKKNYEKTLFDPNSTGLKAIQWDSAELVMLTTSKTKEDYDSFSLQEVTGDLVEKFYYAAGVAPVLSSYLKKLHGDTPPRSKHTKNVLITLEELKEWLEIGDEREKKDKQKLLRNLKILELLAELVNPTITTTMNEILDEIHLIWDDCFCLVKTYLEGDSRKNENYIARFIHIFQSHMHSRPSAREVLVEIVQGNIAIVSAMAETQIGYMITEFASTLDPNFLDFFGSLCVCNNHPIPSTQRQLLKELIGVYGKELFLQTELNIATKEICCYDPKCPGDTKYSLRNLPNIYHDRLFAQLSLMSKLCQGRNEAAISALVRTNDNSNGYVSFDEALHCVQDLQIDAKIRLHYIDIILVMFVDVGDNRSFLDHLCYSFPFNDLCSAPYSKSEKISEKALTGVANTHVPAINEWILSAIASQKRSEEVSEPEYFTMILNILSNLIRFGYYDNIDNIDDHVLHPLIEILSTNLKSDHDNVKIKVLEVIGLIYQFKFYIKLQMFMSDFLELDGNGVIEPISDDKGVRIYPFDCLSEKWLATPYAYINIPGLDSYASTIHDIMPSRSKLVRTLVTLSTSQCPKIVTASLDLLTQLYFVQEELFNKAYQSQILKSDSSLHDYAMVKDKVLPEMRQLLQIESGKQNYGRIIQLLQTLQSLCVFPSTSHPNKQNQIMLTNFGVLSEIMSIVLKRGSDIEGDMINECFKLLQMLSKGHLDVQIKVFNRVNDLLAIPKLSASALINLADLITEIFTGGPQIILKLTERHIEKIFKIMINCDNLEVVSHFLKTLEAMTKIEEMDLPVGHIQSIIIKHFFQCYSFFSEGLLGDEYEGYRCELLQSTDDHPKLMLLLSITSLLAACAEGNNHFIKSVCQSNFNEDEFMSRIMVSQEIHTIRKKPFLHLFCSAFLNSKQAQYYMNYASVLLVQVREASSKDVPDNWIFSDCLTSDIIEFLHIYYSILSRGNSLPETEKECFACISKYLMSNHGENILRYLSTEKHIGLFEDLIVFARSTPGILDDIDPDDIECIFRNIITAKWFINQYYGISKDKGSLPLEQYKQQEELNDRFNVFSSSHLHCYRGQNIASCQIRSNVDDVYSEEGEELPLGSSFQSLLRLYDGFRMFAHDDEIDGRAERLLRQIELSYSDREQLGEAEQEKQDILDCRCLQILRGLIHNKIKMIDSELKQDNPQIFREKYKNLVAPVQSKIQQFGNAIGRIIPLLSHPNEKVSTEVLALMKALLFSGNKEVQDGLLESILQTREETLFLNLKKRLENSGLHFKYIIDLEQEQKQRKKVKSLAAATTTTRYEEILTKVEIDVSLPQDIHEDTNIAIPMDQLDEEKQPLIEKHTHRDMGSISSTDSDYVDELVSPSHLSCLDVLDSTRQSGLALNVIGLMCDGQEKKLQNYLRIQPDNFRTVNVVAEVAGLLRTYTASLDLRCKRFDQIHHILQALIELCVGNYDNQAEVYDQLIMEPLNKILLLKNSLHDETCVFFGGDNQCQTCREVPHLVQMKSSAIELLDIMVEQFHPEAIGIGSSLNTEAVLTTMMILYELKTDPMIVKAEMDDDCQKSLYKAHHVVLILIDHKKCQIKSEGAWQEAISKWSDDMCKFVTQDTRAVEIHYADEEEEEAIVTKVYFPYSPENELREEVTELVRWSIDRDSMEDKQRALMALMPALQTDICHQEKLKKNKFVKLLFDFHTKRVNLLLLLTIIMNLFILFVYSVPDSAKENNRVFLPMFPLWFSILFYVLGAVHLLLSVWLVVEYFATNWPHFRLPSFFYLFMSKVVQFFCRNKRYTYTPLKETCIDVGIFSVSTLYMVLFLICSVLSLGLNGYFYCFCLLLVVVDNDILKRVLKAVTQNGVSLLWVAILGVIVLFIYAVISFAFLQNYFVATDGAALYCETLGQCMYSVLRYGLTDNLGLVIPFDRNGSASSFTPGVFTARLLFDLSFFVIVTTIGLNIVFGIIVDTFSELREERNKIEEEQKSNCFICNIPSYRFGIQGFSDHVKNDHNMWNYIYYSVYLKQIDTGDHNAIQKYVHELILLNDTKFFPQEEACCLHQEEKTVEDNIKDSEMKEKFINMLQEYITNLKQQEQKEGAQAS